MRVLVGCEESGKVRDAFIARGHDAVSCDLIPSRKTGSHLQKCVKLAIVEDGPWDVIILHPDCTKLAVSGNSTYGKGMIKHQERLESIEWTVDLFELASARVRIGVCLENPAGVLPRKRMPKPQYIHPHKHGHKEQKKTGLWLYCLPPLKDTHDVTDEMVKLPKNQRERNHYMAPGPNRKRDRSETYQGIADAMAEQWGSYEMAAYYCGINQHNATKG